MRKRKPGRPPKFLTRDKRVEIRLYEDEYEKIKRRADSMNISVSTFMMIAAREYLLKN